jgi:hypothetical protein
MITLLVLSEQTSGAGQSNVLPLVAEQELPLVAPNVTGTIAAAVRNIPVPSTDKRVTKLGKTKISCNSRSK